MREFLARLGPNDRVLLIGDTRQHQGVEAGRPFEQLQEAGMRTAKLDEIVRQKDPALKSAVELLAKGQVSAALESLQQQGRVKEIPGTEERIRAIARSYVESPEKTLIVSPDNASRRELNVAVRQELKANGTLAPEDHTFRVLVQRQDMTGAERSWASHYEVNDVIRYARGSKSAGIEAGTYGTVVGINPAANLLTVEKSSGELATYDPRRLTGVSVYREIDREFSVGDRIQFTAPDKSLGVANRDLAAIESIAPDGRISARLDNNRQIEFNAKEHRHFDHGYAVTSHSSQGLTAERVLVNADTGVHPDLLNSRFGYVSISRASHEATLFTDDVPSSARKLSADVSKTSALELGMAGIHRSSTLTREYPCADFAGDGRDSPLKYTNVTTSISPTQLGMAGIHRSSTLISLNLQRRFVLGMAGIHRSSTLADDADGRDSCWGWPGSRYTQRRQFPLGYRSESLMADSLKLTLLVRIVQPFRRWGWPGFTAQVH
jgi:ATP-dependent exoDNAse (exonuclease V) alpha subunit